MNTLYYGDNLKVLRKHIEDESVDLIYLDPPFNSKRAYNVIFPDKAGKGSMAQIQAFEDTWHWNEETQEAFEEIILGKEIPTDLKQMMQAFRTFMRNSFGRENDLLAYLTMMAIRLVELRRVLKNTGSIYLHCDPTASHYLKILMDQIFEVRNFRNEITWHYRKWSTGKYCFQHNHDIILFYTKSRSDIHHFNQLYMERTLSTLRRFGTRKIISGYDENGNRIPARTSDESSTGVRMDDVWDIGRVPPIKQLFPTEKPSVLVAPL
jgi:site-specific DNA-methyltransferase (adenine-specific)